MVTARRRSARALGRMAAFVVGLALLSARAHADDEDSARVGRILRLYADEERRERILVGSAGLVASGVTVATGAYLLVERSSYGPWVQLAGWLNAGPPEYVFVRSLVYLALPGPLETLEKHFGPALATEGHGAALTRLELAWQSAANRARRFRYANATIYALFAAGTLGYGAYLVLSRPLDTPPAEGQYVIGAELVVAGLAHAGHALHDALLPSPVERAWRVHVAGFAESRCAGVSVVPFAVAGPLGVVGGVRGAW